MFCKKCGKEVNEESIICIHCGCSLKEDPKERDYGESKTGIGVAMAIFLGLVGLIIGICLYPTGTVARDTFLKGFWITTIVVVAAVIFFYLIIFAGVMSSVPLY